MNIDLDLWKKRKNELNLTFDELAEKSSVSRRQLLYLFKGEGKNTGVETVQRIERALGIEEEKNAPEYTEEEKQLFELIQQLTDEEVKELSNFVDYILSKRK
jgi:transcriptional regulator with XRE-family HTH domain